MVIDDTKTKAWNEGYNSYYESIPRSENPYIKGSDKYDDWEEGWDKADSNTDDEID